MNSILPDYHLHTRFCNHAEGEMESYVEYALGKGLKEIGFADHMPVMPEPHLCMSYKELPVYMKMIHELQKRYEGKISIKLGCEMDIVTERIDEIKDILQKYHFDYVIGSIHYLAGWPFDQEQYRNVFEKNDIDGIYERFFNVIIKAAETGLYDVVGHIDNIKRMGYRPSGSLTPQFEHVASVIKLMNLTVELNTSGIDKACSEAYPSLAFLKMLKNYDIPVTIGSDAHRPEEVGRHFDKAMSILNEVGFEHVVYFKDRERIFKPLKSITQHPEPNGAGIS